MKMRYARMIVHGPVGHIGIAPGGFIHLGLWMDARMPAAHIPRVVPQVRQQGLVKTPVAFGLHPALKMHHAVILYRNLQGLAELPLRHADVAGFLGQGSLEHDDPITILGSHGVKTTLGKGPVILLRFGWGKARFVLTNVHEIRSLLGAALMFAFTLLPAQ